MPTISKIKLPNGTTCDLANSGSLQMEDVALYTEDGDNYEHDINYLNFLKRNDELKLLVTSVETGFVINDATHFAQNANLSKLIHTLAVPVNIDSEITKNTAGWTSISFTTYRTLNFAHVWVSLKGNPISKQNILTGLPRPANNVFKINVAGLGIVALSELGTLFISSAEVDANVTKDFIFYYPLHKNAIISYLES